jgi:hypothetical protein
MPSSGVFEGSYSTHIHKINKSFLKKKGRAWCCTPLIPAFGRQRRGISEFETSLVYKVSCRLARAIQRKPVSHPSPPPPKKRYENLEWLKEGGKFP